VLGNTSADADTGADAGAVAGTVGGTAAADCDDVSLQAEQRSNIDKLTV
jgi:hypothetical protein